MLTHLYVTKNLKGNILCDGLLYSIYKDFDRDGYGYLKCLCVKLLQCRWCHYTYQENAQKKTLNPLLRGSFYQRNIRI